MNKLFLLIQFGELRGQFMADRRRQVFKEKFGRDANFASNIHEKSGLPIDFIEAKQLLNDEDEHLAFQKILEQL